MKRKNLISAIAFVFSVAIFMVSGAIYIHSAQQQTTQSTLNVAYVADNVSFTATAYYQLAGSNNTVSLVNTSDSNNTTLTFTPANTSTTKTLSATSDIALNVTNNYVLLTFAFTNTASNGGYCIKVSLTDGTTDKSNVNVTYLASSSSYTTTSAGLTTQIANVTSTSAPTDVYIQAQQTKYFYVLVEVDNLYVNSNYNSTLQNGLVWDVTGTTTVDQPYVNLNLAGGAGGTNGLSAQSIQYGQAMPSITVPAKSGWSFDGYFDSPNGQGTKYYNASGSSAHVWDKANGCTLYAYWANAESNFTWSENTITGLSSSGANLTEVAIPSRCTALHGLDFDSDFHNDLLTTVNIPSSVTEMALVGCRSLTSVTIGSGVSSIMDGAFVDCTRLTSVTIPASVTSIGRYAFDRCIGLESISVDPNNSTYMSEDNCILNKAGTTLIAGCKNSVIPNTVTTIGSYAFSGRTDLTSITIPSSVTSIEDDAFENCVGLTSVTIPSSVESIGEYAFSGSGLTSIIVPGSVTYIGDFAFSGCDNLATVTIAGDGVEEMGEYAFSCGLRSLTVEGGVVGSSAFEETNELLSVTIGSGVTNIEDWAFAGSQKLYEVYNLSSLPITKGTDTYGRVALNAKVIHTNANETSIYTTTNDGFILYNDGNDVWCMGYAGSQTDITIPNSVTKICDYAFYCNPSLTSVVIPSSVTSIGRCAFNQCRELMSITIGSSVGSIGNNAFDYSYTLYEVYNLSCLPITKGAYNYGYVSRYAKVIHTNVNDTSIYTTTNDGFILYDDGNDVWCMGYKGSQTDIAIPNNVTKICDNAFYENSSLTSVVIPSSVTSIGDRAFSNCLNLESVYFAHSNITSITEVGGLVFYQDPGIGIRCYFKDSEANVRNWEYFTTGHFETLSYRSY